MFRLLAGLPLVIYPSPLSFLSIIFSPTISFIPFKMDAGILWTLPKKGFIKANVHAIYYEDPLPNGNSSGIRVVFRDDRGTILKMYAGTMHIEGRRLNEFYAMIYALRKAFFLEFNKLELDTDHQGAYWEWRFSLGDGVRA